MALLSSEIVRIRAELGYNAVQVANPYLTAYALFETVIASYLQGGAATTSSTAVVATGGDPAIVALTLASITGVSMGDRVVVDVDSLQELATVRSVTGSAISVLLSLAHSGTYPVWVEGGESMAREKLRNIRELSDKIRLVGANTAGVKKADEMEFFSPKEMDKVLGPAGALWQQREWEREELASFLGVIYLRKLRRGNASGELVVY